MKFDSSKLVRLTRPNFYTGKLLTADDLRAAQAYHLQKQWEHNRLLHGYGIVVGLEVALEQGTDGGTRLVVSPGYALDGWGRELVVPEPLSVFLPGDRHDLIIYLKYTADDEDSSRPLTPAPPPEFIAEGVRVLFEPATSERAIAASTRPDFAVPIARVRRPHQEWQRDRNFRPARAK